MRGGPQTITFNWSRGPLTHLHTRTLDKLQLRSIETHAQTTTPQAVVCLNLELARLPLQNLVMKFFSLKFLQFCCAGPWEFTAEVFAEVFFALNVPAKQGRKLRGKLRGKLREKLREKLPPSKTETSPKTSLCRNPLLNLEANYNSRPWVFIDRTSSNELLLQVRSQYTVVAEMITELIRFEPEACIRFRRARTGHKNPPRPEIRKNYKIPHPGLGPENPKNYPKNTKTVILGPFLYFLG